MGWNTVEVPDGTRLFDGLADQRFYFVHSYGVREFPLATDTSPTRIQRPLVTWAEHGDRFVAGVENGALSATQFHPEKSGDAGAQLLTNWIRTLS
jgi:glutamine amidotransferase